MARVALGLMPVVLAATLPRRHAARRCAVTDYGAVGDGTTLDTAAITAAIEACSGAGGGVVVVPAQEPASLHPAGGGGSPRRRARTGRYLSAPFNLTSDLTFEIEAGATLVATTNASLWPVSTRSVAAAGHGARGPTHYCCGRTRHATRRTHPVPRPNAHDTPHPRTQPHTRSHHSRPHPCSAA